MSARQPGTEPTLVPHLYVEQVQHAPARIEVPDLERTDTITTHVQKQAVPAGSAWQQWLQEGTIRERQAGQEGGVVAARLVADIHWAATDHAGSGMQHSPAGAGQVGTGRSTKCEAQHKV
jgi:hypothetical protein